MQWWVPPKSHSHGHHQKVTSTTHSQLQQLPVESDHTRGKINHICVCKQGRSETKDACYYEVSTGALLKENWVSDKTICHQELPFLGELWSIGEVNTGNKTTRELPAKGSFTWHHPSAQPLSCLLLFPLDEPPQFELQPSQPAAAGEQWGCLFLILSNSPQ